MKVATCFKILVILIIFDLIVWITFVSVFHSTSVYHSIYMDTNSIVTTTRTEIDDLSVEYFNSSSRGPNNISCAIQTSKLKDNNQNLELNDVNREFHYVKYGGHYKPRGCKPVRRVAVIIPYRNRKQHLVRLLRTLHGLLQRQILEYGIYVVDVAEMTTFNRALTLNIGFMEAQKEKSYECFIFHDVDLVPENDNNMYTCSQRGPVHMSVGIREWDYRIPYKNLFGGVVGMTVKQFRKVNGFSNKYFGWGGEDDDMFKRIQDNNLTIIRPNAIVAKYHMLEHKKETPNKYRYYLLGKDVNERRRDGLNSLNYTILKVEKQKLFTFVLADINAADPAYYIDERFIPKKFPEKKNKAIGSDLFVGQIQNAIRMVQNIFAI